MKTNLNIPPKLVFTSKPSLSNQLTLQPLKATKIKSNEIINIEDDEDENEKEGLITPNIQPIKQVPFVSQKPKLEVKSFSQPIKSQSSVTQKTRNFSQQVVSSESLSLSQKKLSSLSTNVGTLQLGDSPRLLEINNLDRMSNSSSDDDQFFQILNLSSEEEAQTQRNNTKNNSCSPKQMILRYESDEVDEDDDDDDDNNQVILLSLEDNNTKDITGGSKFQGARSNKFIEDKARLFCLFPKNQTDPNKFEREEDFIEFDIESTKATITKAFLFDLLNGQRLLNALSLTCPDQNELSSLNIYGLNVEVPGLSSALNLSDYFEKKFPTIYSKSYQNSERCRILNSIAFSNPGYIGIRGDGNCFYRATIVAYIIQLLAAPNTKWLTELILRVADNSIPIIELEFNGYQRKDSNKVFKILIRELSSILAARQLLQNTYQQHNKDKQNWFSQASSEFYVDLGKLVRQTLQKIASDHCFDYALIVLCRSMISAGVKEFSSHPHYAEFLLGDDVTYTLKNLKTFKQDAEFHVISLSTEIFRTPIEIFTLPSKAALNNEVILTKNRNISFNNSIESIQRLEYRPVVAKIDTFFDDKSIQRHISVLLEEGHYDLIIDSQICERLFPSIYKSTSQIKQHQIQNKINNSLIN